jgi:3-hydroxyacyl-CoA dehydrogenase/enoyl-CoA hydratase/3-hydroxybutyryl-CoA epimerase
MADAPAGEQIRWERDADGVVVLTMDAAGRSANTMDAAFSAALRATVERLEAERESIAGVVLTSAKGTFFAGADLNELIRVRPEQADELAELLTAGKAVLRRLETLGRPVVAAINGAALGGGLELALACHRRIVVDDPGAVVGFPEVQLGLLPGAGGIARTVRMLGILDALIKASLLEGRRLRPAQALDAGLVDEVVPSVDDLLPAAKAWIAERAEGDPVVQPWDAEGHEIPGGTPSTPAFAASLPAFPANLRKRLKGANYPAPHHIMAAAVEGAQVDFDTALQIETRYFVDLATGQVAKNMIQAFFFDLRRVNGGRGRGRAGEGAEPFAPSKVAVLGAGMMGAAIAYVCAKAGLEVVLADVTLEAAQRGKGHSERLVAKAVQRGRSTQEDADALLARIVPADGSGGFASAAGADLLIEAVFEDPALKRRVYAEVEPRLAPDALLGSNTSTLPITQLAQGVTRPADFVGMHFFSPVERMPLLEIVRGERTSDETIARALDVARLIGKTPIVVNDSRGFYTSRVIGTFANEAIGMLVEGVPAPSIEQASSQAGYPVPVLQLCDELNMRLMRRIRDAYRDAALAEGGEWVAHPAEQVIERMLDEYGRAGRLDGAGFYEYDDGGGRVGLWPGLREAFGGDNLEVPFEDLKERLLFVESIETVRCLDEGVIESIAEANVGSIMGIGFPAWTGGALQFVNGYEHPVHGRGPVAFVARARELAERYGERFAPPASLVAKAARDEAYGDDAIAAAA